MTAKKNAEVKRTERAMKMALETEMETFDLITLILREEFDKELKRINPQKSVNIPDRFGQRYVEKVSKPKSQKNRYKVLSSA